ncbi:hypothetical protein HDU67_003340 [Dinochytrium kinnereticum]|nr:hypothetical protein HDU67_003340 [Dinochytrium kinnereticum]
MEAEAASAPKSEPIPLKANETGDTARVSLNRESATETGTANPTIGRDVTVQGLKESTSAAPPTHLPEIRVNDGKPSPRVSEVQSTRNRQSVGSLAGRVSAVLVNDTPPPSTTAAVITLAGAQAAAVDRSAPTWKNERGSQEVSSAFKEAKPPEKSTEVPGPSEEGTSTPRHSVGSLSGGRGGAKLTSENVPFQKKEDISQPTSLPAVEAAKSNNGSKAALNKEDSTKETPAVRKLGGSRVISKESLSIKRGEPSKESFIAKEGTKGLATKKATKKEGERGQELPAGIAHGGGMIASIDHSGSTDYETDIETKKGKKSFVQGVKKNKRNLLQEDDSFQVAMIKMLAAEQASEGRGLEPHRDANNVSRSRQRSKQKHFVGEDDDGYNTAVPSGNYAIIKPYVASNSGSGYESFEENRIKAKRKHREDDLFKNKKSAKKRDHEPLKLAKHVKVPESEVVIETPNPMPQALEKPTTSKTPRIDNPPSAATKKPQTSMTKKKPLFTSVDEEAFAKLEQENIFLKKHLDGLQTNNQEVWGKEAALTEKIRGLEEGFEEERREKEMLDAENRELKGKIAALKRQVLKEANRAAFVPKIIPNRVPASVEANINLRHQFHQRLTLERDKYARLEEENRELVARVKSLEMSSSRLHKASPNMNIDSRKAMTTDAKSTHRVNEILFWKKRIRDVELEKSKVEETLASLTRQLEKGDHERERLSKELESTRALLSQHLARYHNMNAFGADLLLSETGTRQGTGVGLVCKKMYGSSSLRSKVTAKPTLRNDADFTNSSQSNRNSVKGKFRQSSMPPLSRASHAGRGDEEMDGEIDGDFLAVPNDETKTVRNTREGRSLLVVQRRARSSERARSSQKQEDINVPLEVNNQGEQEEEQGQEQELEPEQELEQEENQEEEEQDLESSRDFHTPSKSDAKRREISSRELFSAGGTRTSQSKPSKPKKPTEPSSKHRSNSTKRPPDLKAPKEGPAARRKRVISESLPPLFKRERHLVIDSDNEERPIRFAFRDSSTSMYSVKANPPPFNVQAQAKAAADAAAMETLMEDEDVGPEEGAGEEGRKLDEERLRAARTQIEYDIYVGSKKTVEV